MAISDGISDPKPLFRSWVVAMIVCIWIVCTSVYAKRMSIKVLTLRTHCHL